MENIIPIIIKINDNKQVVIIELFDNKEILSGIKSVIDTDSITPEAKAREEDIIIFSFFVLKNINIDPIKVEKPAKKVNKNDIIILFIVSPFNYMYYRNYL